MKTFITLFVCVLMLAGVALAAAIDGQWVSERKMNRNGEEMTITQTFDLKSDGAKLTGSIAMKMGDNEPRTSEIKDGKIDGNKFSFTVVMTTPNGEMKTAYEGTVEGDSLKGTAAREGGQARPFEAKKK
ncbi:hypothetical protein [Paludibaculum fermentans]|uniref:Uncharacterized protein n=1 Tax=Paludibaculum fermentans TaxID=1473598 RepID=A0A7S7NQ43_PALFE|nr:hypothetical protein [Paludibaculum fermentans]QOY87716.1 hypothetical protein IRI77_34055 [Paludibaculum fermentans]